MRRCPACQQTAEPEARFCTACGARVLRGGWAEALAPEGEDGRWRLGRGPDNEVTLESPVVSTGHLLLERRGGRWLATDLGSTNGSFADGRRLPPHEAVPIDAATSLSLGTLTLTGAAVAAGLERGLVELSERALIGRAAEAELRLDSPAVSPRHALLERRGGRWWIRDLGSAAGTWVNGARIRGWTALSPTDRVELGGVRLRPSEAGLEVVDVRRSLRLDVDGVSVSAPDGTPLLHEVSLSVQPGELVLLLGPSGAGKSTLMRVMSGAMRPDAGAVRVNGEDLHDNPGALAGLVGYVPQQVILPPHLSAEEILRASAQLRLPPAAVEERLARVLADLELEEQAGLSVGGPGRRGALSGGQERRVNLGVELLTDPGVLLMDEPCAGLDARAGLRVVKLARELADRGRPVVLSVHQPRAEALELADLVILLSRGRLVWFGPTAELRDWVEPAWEGPPPHPDTTAADLAVDALEPPEPGPEAAEDHARGWAARYRNSPAFESWVRQRLEPVSEAPAPRPRRTRRKVRSRPAQLAALTRRYARGLLKDPQDVLLLLGQAPALALLIALLFGEGRFVRMGLPGLPLVIRDQLSPALFMMAAVMLWLGCNNAARELVRERALYLRERRAGLRSGVYLASKLVVLSAVTLGQAAVLTLGAAWMGLPELGRIAATLTLTGWAGVSAGLLISATARSEFVAVLLVPLVVLPQLLLGGLIEPYGELGPLLQRVADRLVPLRSSFEALALLTLPPLEGGVERLMDLGLVPRGEPLPPWNGRLPWVVLWVILPLLGVWEALHRQGTPRRRR